MRDSLAAAESSRDAARARAAEQADEASDLRDEMNSLRKSHLAARDALAAEKEKVSFF